MVVDDLDLVGIVLAPDETDPPLLIDADRVPAFPIPLECFQPICRRHAQVFESPRIVEKTQLSKGDILNVRRQLAVSVARPDSRGLVVMEADDRERV